MASSSSMAVKQSISSTTTATRHPKPVQMGVDIRGRDHCSSSAPSSSSGPAQSKGNDNMNDKELISPESRLSRIPTAVPSITSSTQHTNAAISASKNNLTHTLKGQDVHDFVNNSASLSSSTASPSQGQLPLPETSVSSFPQPITQHGLTHPIRRPRTSAIYSRALAPNHGIPQRLPPPPRPLNRPAPIPVSIKPTPVDSFQDLRNSYLTMLSTEPTDHTVAAPVPVNTASTDAQASGSHLGDRDFEMLVNLITSPAFKDLDSFEDTSPHAPSLMDDFDASPYETPYQDFLNTPVMPEGGQDDMLTSPAAEYLDFNYSGYTYGNAIDEPVVQSKATIDYDMLLQISPQTPMLDSFDPSQLYPSPRLPSTVQKSTAPAATSSLGTATTATGSRRRSTATGVRKGITPDALLDEEAPTQPRKYATPSATSRKDVPAVFARKRSRSTAFGEEEDQLDELPPNPTERDLIEAKRRQNTVAARRSRKRKLEQMQTLERSAKVEKHQKEVLQSRLDMMMSLCRSAGVTCPDFPPIDIPDDL